MKVLTENPVKVFSTFLMMTLFPILILGKDSVIDIHDNLDGPTVSMVVLANSGTTFDYDKKIEQVMNGIPRSSFSSPFEFTSFLYTILPPINAFQVNYAVIHLTAFFGMFLLLVNYFQINSRVISAAVAFVFGILPFIHTANLSISGLPLLLYAILNIIYRTDKKNISYIIVFIFPFFSSLVFIGVFLLTTLFLYSIYLLTVNKNLSRKIFPCILLLGLGYSIVNFDMLRGILSGSAYLSHRSEFDFINQSISLEMAIDRSWINFKRGQYHAISLHRYFLIYLVPLALFFAYLSRSYRHITNIVILVVFGFTGSIIYGFSVWEGLIPMKQQYSILAQFQFGRFHFFHPVIWYILFAICLSVIYNYKYSIGKYTAYIAIILQSNYLLTHDDELTKSLEVLNCKLGLNNNGCSNITYRKYFSTALFDMVREHINRKQKEYRVVSIGMHPSVAAYNGFYVLDYYTSMYPLEYKHQFRKLISDELDKNAEIRDYFDKWGSRCYVFSSELGTTFHVKDSRKISDFTFNTDLFIEMGGEYILSAVEIINHKDSNLSFVKKFEESSTPRKIYLYKAI